MINKQMAHKVVYLQENDKVAAQFEEAFSSENIELVHVKSGEEALEFMGGEEVLLLLIDINIPDMRLGELVYSTREISPRTIINVCIDVFNPQLITKLANKYSVHKIFLAPWNIPEIVEHTKESIEIAIINGELARREDKVTSEIDEMKATLTSLQDRLRKQKRSYAKLSNITKCFTDSLSENKDSNEITSGKHEFVKDVFDALLRLQTGNQARVDHFEDGVRADLAEIREETLGLKTGEIISCLIGNQPWTVTQNIRFSIYLIARLFAEFYDGFEVSVSSHYITTKEAEFIVTVIPDEGTMRQTAMIKVSGKSADGTSDGENDIEEEVLLIDEYYEYVQTVISSLTVNYRRTLDDDIFRFYMSFGMSNE